MNVSSTHGHALLWTLRLQACLDHHIASFLHAEIASWLVRWSVLHTRPSDSSAALRSLPLQCLSCAAKSAGSQLGSEVIRLLRVQLVGSVLGRGKGVGLDFFPVRVQGLLQRSRGESFAAGEGSKLDGKAGVRATHGPRNESHFILWRRPPCVVCMAAAGAARRQM